MNTHRRLIETSWKSGILLPLSVLTGIGVGILVLAQSWYLSVLIDGLFLHKSGVSTVLPILRILLGVITARAAFVFLNGWFSGRLAEKVKFEFRQALFGKIDRLGSAWLKRQKTGEVAAVLLQGVDALDNYISQFLPQGILAAVLPLIILFVVFPLDLLTGFILLVTAPLIPLFMVLIGRMAERATKRQWLQLIRMSDFLLDSIRGLKTLLLLGRNRQRLDAIKTVSEEYRIKTLNVLKITFLSAFTLEMIATIATAVVAVEIGLRLLYGNLDFQTAFFILLLAPEFYLPMRNLSMRYHAGMGGVTAAISIFKILDAPEVTTLTTGAGSAFRSIPAAPLVFRGVTFRYPESDVNALEQINFEFQYGRHYVLAGENGSGKTTLLNLAMQFLQPGEGSIELAGQDIRTWDVQEWRKNISWIGQKPTLFNTTLLENVRLFDTGYSEEQVVQALENARLGNLLASLPEGLNTQMQEMGARMSSGEGQRLAIARAFLKNGAFVLMDEPASHLDAALYQEILDALRALMEGRTAIIAAHHYPLMRIVDEIVVLNSGKLVDSGTFDVLEKRGRFSSGIGKT